MTRAYTVRRSCPACSRRWNMVAAPDCPICQGDGYLTLGTPGLRKYPAEALSRAVEIALELRATADVVGVHVPDLAAARRNQTIMVNRLVRAGILAGRNTPPEPAPPNTRMGAPVEEVTAIARAIAVAVSGVPFDPQAEARLAATPLPDAATIPVNGAIPPSILNYVCLSQRVNDPKPVLDRADVNRAVTDREGELLGRVVFDSP